MKSTLTVFALGLILGSTLGIGGMYTQVLEPAWAEVKQLEAENGVMEDALDEAGSALREVAVSLRDEAAPAPIRIRDVTGGTGLPKGVAPSGIESGGTKKNDDVPSDTHELADRLDSLAEKLKKARTTEAN